MKFKNVIFRRRHLYIMIRVLIALVWLINGLICKLAGLVPRHKMIIAEILGYKNSGLYTNLVGIAEIGMALWILCGWYKKINAWTQVIIIATMNVLEFLLVPELLLWGRWNALFALLLILVIIANEYFIRFFFYPLKINK